jgi:hypothetical protein
MPLSSFYHDKERAFGIMGCEHIQNCPSIFSRTIVKGERNLVAVSSALHTPPLQMVPQKIGDKI